MACLPHKNYITPEPHYCKYKCGTKINWRNLLVHEVSCPNNPTPYVVDSEGRKFRHYYINDVKVLYYPID
jgi:hypothetical protein